MNNDKEYHVNVELFFDLPTMEKSENINIKGRSIVFNGYFSGIVKAATYIEKEIDEYNAIGVYFDQTTIKIK